MRIRWSLALLAAGLALTAAAQKGNSFTPMPQVEGFGVIDTSAPPLAPEEIIRRFTARETEFEQALGHYSWRRSARVQTIDEDNNVDGEYYQVDDITFDSTGKHTEKTVYAPPNTLRRVMMSPTDLQNIQSSNFFVLTSAQIGHYNLNYAGRQKVDEVDCYVFDVRPTVLEKKIRYFSGRIWVATAGLQIVVTEGRMVSAVARKKDLDPPLMTWRQPVDGHYWFPAYARAEGTLHFTGGRGFMPQNVHIRDTIKYTGYKRLSAAPQAEQPEK
ncbi:MAG: hypothetical protein ABSD72_11070 [Terracidiphilus sp.]|jgi:hypothetical protein